MGESMGGSFNLQLRSVRDSWPSRGWTWDERSGCVASSFSVENQDEYQTILERVFPRRWDHLTIRQAPSEIASIAARTGGIRHGQWMYSPDVSTGAFAYALWWPWGDDTNVSVRVALSPDGQTSRATLRALFGVDGDL